MCIDRDHVVTVISKDTEQKKNNKFEIEKINTPSNFEA